MIKRQGRVLVQLKNLNGEEQQLNEIRHCTDPFPRPPGSFHKHEKTAANSETSNTSTPFVTKKIIKKIKKHDETTLFVDIKEDFSKSCHLKNYCHFDVVGNEYDRSIHTELENVAVELITNKTDCVLINIEAQRRECPVRELGEILVTNVTSQLQSNSAELQKIIVEYCDLRKYDVVNMLGKRGKPADMEISIEFPTLLTFLKWLNQTYPNLWKSGQNHDVIDVQLVILDKNQQTHTHRLSIFYFYLSKMDIWTRIEFTNFLKNMRIEKPQTRQTMIANCLREYFNASTSWSSWFYFKIPNSLQSHSNIIYDMLQMAVSVFEKSNDLLHKKNILGVMLSSGVNKTEINQPSAVKPLVQIESMTKSKTPLVMVSKEVEKKVENVVEDDITRSVNEVSDIKTDNDRLSYWYNQMDEKFGEVVAYMKDYYQCQYQQNMFNMNKEIENIACTVGENNVKQMSDENDSEVKLKMKLRIIRARYMKALKLFRGLNQRFVCSSRYNALNVYFKQKCAQLDQMERKFIKKRLKICKRELSLILTNHLGLSVNKMIQTPTDNLKSEEEVIVK